MPDLAPVVGALFDLIGPLLGTALRTFLGTAAGMFVLGIGLAIYGFRTAAEAGGWKGLLAALASLGIALALGVVLAGKRAIGKALARGIQGGQLGRRTVGMLFERMLGLDTGGDKGERGGSLARTLERLPLAEAETRLASAVRSLVDAPPDARGLKAKLARKIQLKLLDLVEKVTVARFRQEGQAGGIDLALVRDELSDRMDQMLSERVQGALARVTIVLIVIAVAASVAASHGIARL